MRKILTVLAALFLSVPTISQDRTVKARMVQVGEWDARERGWQWGETVPSTVSITFSVKYISIDNKEGSFFTILSDDGERTGRLTSDPSVTYKGHSWRARDRRGRTCQVSIVGYSSLDYDVMFNVMYDNVCIRFYLPPTETGLDPYSP